MDKKQIEGQRLFVTHLKGLVEGIELCLSIIKHDDSDGSVIQYHLDCARLDLKKAQNHLKHIKTVVKAAKLEKETCRLIREHSQS